MPQTIESFFSRKRESWKRWEACHINSFNNNDIGANVEGMQPVMRDYGKNPQNVCKRKIVLSHFGLTFQVLETNTAAVTYVELTVSALNVLSYIKMFWPLKTFTSLIMNFFFLENR